MADGYEPPKGSVIMGILAAVFLIVGIGTLPLLFVIPEIIALPAAFMIFGIIFLLFYLDLKSPNGKLTLVEKHPHSYTIVKRNSVKTHPEDAHEQNVTDRWDANVQPSYDRKDRKKKKNTTGVYTYFNCPYCGSLNESGNDKCRNCGKKF